MILSCWNTGYLMFPLVSPADLEEETEPEELEPEKEKPPEPESSGSPPSLKTEEAPDPDESPPPAPALAKDPDKQRPPEKPLLTQRFKIVLPKIATPDPALRDVILRPDLALEFPADYSPKLPPVMQWAMNPRELENALLVEPGWKQPEDPVRWELPEAEPQLLASNEQPAPGGSTDRRQSGAASGPSTSCPAGRRHTLRRGETTLRTCRRDSFTGGRIELNDPSYY